jgi:hypothetical protein
MSNDPFSLDFAEFDRRFLEYAVTKAPEAAKQGMFEALGELKHDADSVQPMTPYLEGHLRSEHTKTIEAEPGNIVAKLVFLMPYAARMHEGKASWKWTRTRVPSPGPKFLETKMMMFGKKYFQIVANRIKDATGG